MMESSSGIYIHIPFCIRKCNYCAFLSFSPSEEEREKYIDALVREIGLRVEECGGRVFDTVYFGGGTPSVLSPEQVGRVIGALRENFNIVEGAEITLEANPGTLGGSETEVLEQLGKYRKLGINRLSMGVQSMNDERLKFLGRIHDSETVRRDFRLARQTGFDNINLDIIFSVPGESMEDALTDIKGIASLGPEHISFYSLQLEEGTPFFSMWENREFDEVDDETDRQTYHRGCKLLVELGYEHYEISNFAKTINDESLKEKFVHEKSEIRDCLMFGGQVRSVQPESIKSRHNSKYWSMTDYLAFGLGASGMLTECKSENERRTDDCEFRNRISENVQIRRERYKNVSDMNEYIGLINEGRLPIDEITENTEHDNISETIFTGLRRREGVRYDECFGNKEEFWNYYADVRGEAESFVRSGHLIIDNNGLRLTEVGIDISNKIMSLFV